MSDKITKIEWQLILMINLSKQSSYGNAIKMESNLYQNVFLISI